MKYQLLITTIIYADEELKVPTAVSTCISDVYNNEAEARQVAEALDLKDWPPYMSVTAQLLF